MGWRMQYKDKVWEKEGNLLEVIKKEGLEGKVFGAKINGVFSDLNVYPQDESLVELLDWENEEGRNIYRHTSAHILAHAVKELFPEVKLGIGPAIDDGFYYDFYRSEPFSQEDLEKIENKMKEIINHNLPIERIEVTREEATKLLKDLKEDFKLELLEEIPEGEKISFYRQGSFMDLCRGPHLPSTGWVKAFKLLSVSGAYWRGDEKNPMFQRIYGTSFPSEEELKKIFRGERRGSKKRSQKIRKRA